MGITFGRGPMQARRRLEVRRPLAPMRVQRTLSIQHDRKPAQLTQEAAEANRQRQAEIAAQRRKYGGTCGRPDVGESMADFYARCERYALQVAGPEPKPQGMSASNFATKYTVWRHKYLSARNECRTCNPSVFGLGFVNSGPMWVPDQQGEVGPVRFTMARRRHGARGPDYAYPAEATMRYVDQLEARSVPSDRQVPRGALEVDRDAWDHETYGFDGITYESMRVPPLTFFPDDD